MKNAQIGQAVREFHATVREVEEVMDALNDVLGTHPESKLSAAVWAVVGRYKSALDDAYGIGGWLEWWWLECRLGSNPLRARLQGEEMRIVANVDELVTLVVSDAEQAQR